MTEAPTERARELEASRAVGPAGLSEEEVRTMAVVNTLRLAGAPS